MRTPDEGQEQATANGDVVDRRAMLRRGGAVLAGMAGLGIAGVASAQSAGAAPGDPVLQGHPNTVGNAVTTVTSTSADATLVVDNTSTSGSPLRVAEQPYSTVLDESQSGDVHNLEGELFYTHLGPAEFGYPIIGSVYTSAWASMLAPIEPQRVIDTRKSDGRARIMDKSSLDSLGRLVGGKRIRINLSDFVYWAYAFHGNVTVTQPAGGGYVTLAPHLDAGQVPGTSTVNFTTAQTIANFAVSGVAFTDSFVPYVTLYARSTTHVILDATAFTVGDPWMDLVGGFSAASASDRDDLAATRAKILASRGR